MSDGQGLAATRAHPLAHARTCPRPFVACGPRRGRERRVAAAGRWRSLLPTHSLLFASVAYEPTGPPKLSPALRSPAWYLVPPAPVLRRTRISPRCLLRYFLPVLWSAHALCSARPVVVVDNCGELVGGGASCCAGKGGTRCAHAWDRGCFRGSSSRVNWTVAARACPRYTPSLGTLVSIAALQPDPGSLQGRQRLGRVRHSVPESRLSGREVLGQESPPGGSAGRGRGAASRPRRTGKAPLRGKPLAHG